MRLTHGKAGSRGSDTREDPRPRWSIRLGLALLLTAIAAAAAMGVRTTTAAGPLTAEDDPRVDVRIGVPGLQVGQTFCYGSVVLSNPSGQPAKLESVQVHGGAGLTVGTPHVMGPARTDTLATADTCPTGASALKGYVVPPGAGTGEDLGVEVMLPIRIDRRGKHRIEGITVTYRFNGRTYGVPETTDVFACTYQCEVRPGGR